MVSVIYIGEHDGFMYFAFYTIYMYGRAFIYFAFGNIYVIWGAQRFYIFARVVYMT